MQIPIAVIPVAGLGSRLLPATKSQPKEMLPVAKKPVVQYVVEELHANGIRQVLFITGKNKTSIENHFDFDPELSRNLQKSGRQELLADLDFEDTRASFFYTRQRQQRGLGDAVLCARSYTQNLPFVVALGDSIIGLHGQSRVVERMADLFEAEQANCIIAVEEVPLATVSSYGIVKPGSDLGNGAFVIDDLVEKPTPRNSPSNLAIAARYILGPEIYEALQRTQPGKAGEIQLTDAIKLLLDEGKRILAVRLSPSERRYDIGNFESYFETFIEFALAECPHLARLIRLPG